MSRCFPYPPPGFEPPVDLINKEKHKEKKHKKDKKEKHREKDKKDKKEKKEKHKHKKKEKEKDREKSKEKDKTRVSDKTLEEDSRFLDEHVKRVGDGSHSGPTNQSSEKRDKKLVPPIPVPVPVPSMQKPDNHTNDFAEKRERKSLVPSMEKPNFTNPNLLRQRPTSLTNNHRVPNLTERRIGQVSQDDGMTSAKQTVPNALNSKNPNFSAQRKSNGLSTQVNNNNNNHSHQLSGFSERKVGVNEMKKPVPVPVPIPVPVHEIKKPVPVPIPTNEVKKPVPVVPNSGNSVQAKTNGSINQRISSNHVVPPQVEKNREEKREKRKERSEEKARAKELRREEKRRRKERGKEEKRQRKRDEKEREKGREREKVNEMDSSPLGKPNLEGPKRNIAKLGGGLSEISNKRKEIEGNGFLNEDEMRPQKLLRVEPQNRKDYFTNGSVLHENEGGPTKLNKKLPFYPPPQNGKSTTHPTTNNINTNTTTPIPKNTLNPQNTQNTQNVLNTLDPQNNNNHNPELEVPKLPNGTVSDANGIKKKEPKPHRDLKYLSVVYSVPKLKEEELQPEVDEQEWLFGTNPNPNSNPNPNLTRVESSRVWDRAVKIDSVDTFALPYVIPF